MQEHANTHEISPELRLNVEHPSWSRGFNNDIRVFVQAISARCALRFVRVWFPHLGSVECFFRHGDQLRVKKGLIRERDARWKWARLYAEGEVAGQWRLLGMKNDILFAPITPFAPIGPGIVNHGDNDDVRRDEPRTGRLSRG